MKILIVDDMSDRHESLQELLSQHTVLSTYNCEQALEALKQHNDITAVFLDHDLGYVNGKQEDIKPVVRYIVENCSNLSLKCAIVHSANIIEAPKIAATLAELEGLTVAQMSFGCFMWSEWVREILAEI